MAESKETKCGWTVMSYMAGDNNLAEEMVLALQQFMRPSQTRNYLVQFDPTMLGIPTQRYAHIDPRVGKPLDDFVVDAPAEENEFNETNTGHPGALSGFVQWAIADPKKQRNGDPLGACEADNYALILSGHGSGATGGRFLADEYPQDAMSIQELDEALTNARHLVYVTKKWEGEEPPTAEELKTALDERLGRKLNEQTGQYEKVGTKKDPPKLDLKVLGLDACFMSMIEVCYEVRRHVKYVVGAEGFEAELGWPYDRIFNRLDAIEEESKEPVEAAVFAKTIVEEYVDHYSDFEKTAGRAVDLAAIDTEKLGDLISPFKALTNCLRAALDKDELKDLIVLAHWDAQSYKFQQYVDLVDFCDCLRHRLRGTKRNDEPKHEVTKKSASKSLDGLQKLGVEQLKERTAKRCDEVIEAVTNCVLLSMCSGWQYQFSYGLSIYFPWSEVAENYRKLEFCSDTKWDDFLGEYVKKTRREPERKGFQKYTMEEKRQQRGHKLAVNFLETHRHGPRVERHGPRVERHGPRVERFGVASEGSMKNFPEGCGRAEWLTESWKPEAEPQK